MNKKQEDYNNFIVNCCIFSLKNSINYSDHSYNFINNNFSELYEVAKEHKVLPAFFDFLLKNTNLLSKKNQFFVQEQFKRKTFSKLLKTKELLNLYKQFTSNNIEIIPYKGVVYTQEMYKNISLRSFNDIDFWYKKKDTASIKRILEENGYKSIPSYSKLEDFFFTKISCEYHFVKYQNDQRILVEPHFWLSNHFTQVNPRKNDLEENRKMKLINREISIFSLEMTFLYIILHHGTTSNWALLKHHFDLAMFIKKYFNIDWSKILKLCEEFKLKEVALVGVLNVKTLFKIELPQVLEQAIEYKGIRQLSNLSLKYSFKIKDKWYSTLYKIFFLVKSRKGIDNKILLILRIIEYSFYRIIFESLMFFKR